MTDIKSNIPTYAEEKIINNPEQEEIQELRGQLRTLEEENARLKNELTEQKKHADKMDSLVREMHEAKNKLEAENQELKLKIKLDEEDYLDNLRYGIYNDKGKEEEERRF